MTKFTWKQKVTLIGCGVIVGLIILFDVVMLILGGDSATVSAVIYNTAKEYPVIPFAVGFAMSHLFWAQDEKTRGETHDH
jgi:hypothetical protein